MRWRYYYDYYIGYYYCYHYDGCYYYDCDHYDYDYYYYYSTLVRSYPRESDRRPSRVY